MAKKAAKNGKAGDGRKKAAKATVVARPRKTSNSSGGGSSEGMGDAFIKLLQSPLVAELVAVAATAALAALAEQGFNSRAGGNAGKRAGRAVKEAGKAAAAAVGRRLSTEIDEIRKASKAGAKS